MGLSPQQRRVVAWILIPSSIVIVAAFVAARLSSTQSLADFFDNLHWTVAYLCSAVLGWLGLRWADADNLNARRWFSYGLTLSAIGQLVWDVQSLYAWEAYFAPSDALFLCFGPCCAYGMFCAIRDHQRRPLSSALILDVTMFALIVLIIVIAIILPRSTSAGFGRFSLLMYPLSMFMGPCITVAMFPTLKLLPRPQWLLFLGAQLANGVAWMQWIYLSQDDTLTRHPEVYLLFSVVVPLLGWGALLWRLESSVDPAWERRCEGLLRMLPLFAVSGAAVSVALAWSTPKMSQATFIVICSGAAVTLVLAFARQSLLLFERDRLFAAEKRAREVEHQFRSLFHTVRDGLALLDANGTFLEVNPACTQLFGFTRSELLKMNVAELYEGDRMCVANYLALVRSEGGGFVATRFVTKEGCALDVEISSGLLPGSNGEVVLMVRDISERKRTEDTRARLEAHLRQAQKLEAIGTLASGIAHDFNNILVAILGHVELALQDSGANSPALTSLQEIRRAGQRAKELIRRIMTFGRPQETNARALQLRAVIEDAMQLVGATLPASVEITLSLEAQAPHVMVDAAQISQVLLNLCTNAYQAMAEHKGRICISLDVVDLDEHAARTSADLHPGRYVCLKVEDSGSGIDPAIAEQIFEPFFTTKPIGEGNGLGLSIVHGIARAHGGAVKMQSQLGAGTTFYFYLPAATSPALETGVVSVPRENARGSNEHILYVDDEEPLVYLTQRLLERRGYRVSGYTDPRAALNAFLADASSFDLVITDQAMPGMQGTDLAQEILRARPTTKIVLVSGYLRPHEIEQAKAVGVQAVILKPDTVEELAAAVHRLLTSAADIDSAVTRTDRVSSLSY